MGSPVGRLSISEQISKNVLPDLLISGCSAATFEPTLPDEPTKQTAIRIKTENKRMEPPSLGKEVYFDSLRQQYSKRLSVLFSCRLASWTPALREIKSG